MKPGAAAAAIAVTNGEPRRGAAEGVAARHGATVKGAAVEGHDGAAIGSRIRACRAGAESTNGCRDDENRHCAHRGQPSTP
jgi:hypothetical protein